MARKCARCDELAERVIKAERDRDHAVRTLREHIDWAGGERSETSYVLAQQARIHILEQNVNRLIGEREQKAA